MRRRRLISKKAISSNDDDISEQFKCARKLANNAMKHAKKRQFSDNSEASKDNLRKTWNLVNEFLTFSFAGDSPWLNKDLQYITLHNIFLFRFIRYMPTVASVHCWPSGHGRLGDLY